MNLTDTDALELAAGARVARLATVRPDGAPHVVPIVFAFEGDDLVTAVDHKPKRTAALQRLANIRDDPRVSVLIDHYAPDWNALWWVRIDGRARIVASGDEFARAVAALAGRYEQYRVEPEGPAIRVSIDRVSGWTAGHR